MYEEEKKKITISSRYCLRANHIYSLIVFFLHTHISLRNDAIIQDYYYAGMRMKMTIDRRWIPGRGGEKERKKKWRRHNFLPLFESSRRPSNRSARLIKKEKKSFRMQAHPTRSEEIRICSQGRWFEEKRAGSLGNEASSWTKK